MNEEKLVVIGLTFFVNTMMSLGVPCWLQLRSVLCSLVQGRASADRLDSLSHRRDHLGRG